MQPIEITSQNEWNALVATLPHAHILQTWEWGDFKQQTTGWQPQRFAYRDADGQWVAAASVLTRRIGIFCVMYVPKGAVLDYQQVAVRDAVLDHLQSLAKQRRAIWLKIDPDLPLATGIPNDDSGKHPDQPHPTGTALQQVLQARGWRYSADQVQFPNTLVNDLTQSEDAILAGMNQSTRRKLRKAEKAGVIVREAQLSGQDLETLYQMYTVTSQRQGFLIRPLSYYRLVWEAFAVAGLAIGLLAEVEGEPVAGAVFFHFGQKVWFFYGMTTETHRDSQANYVLHWQAIRWAKAQGYALYDWWGAPTIFTEDDPLWGVYRFKDGFGGQVVRHIGAWDYAPNRWRYAAYTIVLPAMLRLWRHLRAVMGRLR